MLPKCFHVGCFCLSTKQSSHSLTSRLPLVVYLYFPIEPFCPSPEAITFHWIMQPDRSWPHYQGRQLDIQGQELDNECSFWEEHHAQYCFQRVSHGHLEMGEHAVGLLPSHSSLLILRIVPAPNSLQVFPSNSSFCMQPSVS
jgi:hypothetical protein